MKNESLHIELFDQLDRNGDSTNTITQVTTISKLNSCKVNIFFSIFHIFALVYKLLLVHLVTWLRNFNQTLVHFGAWLRNLKPQLVHLIASFSKFCEKLVHLIPWLRNFKQALVQLVASLRNVNQTLVHLIGWLRNYWAFYRKIYTGLCICIQYLNHYLSYLILCTYKYYLKGKNKYYHNSFYFLIVHKPIHRYPLRHQWQGNDADQFSSCGQM